MNPQLRRSVLDYAPLILFFVAYKIFDLYVATATVMAAAVAAVVLGYWFDRKVHPLPLATAAIILVFGGLTLYLDDPVFIKMKPTMVYALFSAVLLGGLLFKRPMVKYIFATAVTLPEAAWRALTWRIGLFFLCMAILNELIWRNFSSNIWVYFHTFGAIALTVLFFLTQVPFLLRHNIEDDD